MRKLYSSLIPTEAVSLLLIIFGLSVFASGIAAGQSNRFEAGVSAKNRGQHLTAIRSWLPLAEDGMAKAQLNLGHMYHEGLGVDIDYGIALDWYESAAAEGLPEALFNIGLLYQNGSGVEQNLERAIELYTEAEQQGVAAAKYMLGAAQISGEGLPKDSEAGRARVLSAALSGVPSAQFTYATLALSAEGALGIPNSGIMSFINPDMPAEGDPLIAYIWARIAKENGFESIEIDDVIDIALILLSGESPDAEDIVVECIASNLENCPTAD